MEFEWPRLDEPMPFWSRGRAYGAIVVAAVRYPELASLLPARQPDDPNCEFCAGSGHHPLAGETADDRVICECGGLGFVPVRNPDGEAAPPLPRGNVFPDITPSRFKMTRFYQVDSDQDIRDEAELERLIRTMHADPESEVVYYRPKDRINNVLVQSAIDRGLMCEGEHVFFHFRREGPKDRNFVQIERNESEESGAEVIFGHEKRRMMWARSVAGGEMFIRTSLRLTDRMRRHLDRELTANRNPVEAKPGVFGFSVDLFKLWDLFRSWLRNRRR